MNLKLFPVITVYDNLFSFILVDSICNFSDLRCKFLFLFVCDLTFSGESVEENANVVVKLLIRRPECFGPALRGEGGQGLLAAMKEAIKISEDPALDLPNLPEGVTPT